MSTSFTFDERAAVEAILYIAQESRDASFHRIAKLLYFADLLHLERYGRFICGDYYVAMKHGPVPSGVYDMLKAERDGVKYLKFPTLENAFEVVDGYRVRLLRAPNLEWLGDSDVECLNESIAKYDRYTFDTLTQKSHDAAWKSADENDFISIEDIVQMLGNPPGLLDVVRGNSEPEDYILAKQGVFDKLLSQVEDCPPSDKDWESELDEL